MRYAQLRAFHAVGLLGSFSKAARFLSLTQPAVSDHIRKLEDSYGVQLIFRTSRKLELTQLGLELFGISEKLFENEEEAVRLLSGAKALEKGELVIGADAAVHILPAVTAFREVHPAIGIRLMSGNSTDLLSKLDTFQIDFAVIPLPPESEQFISSKLKSDRLVAVAGGKWFQSGRRQMSLADLMQLPLIQREEGSRTRLLLTEELGRRQLKSVMAIEVEGRESVHEAAAQGLGVAIMPEGEVVPDSRLTKVEISDWNCQMEEWLVCLKSRADRHVIRTFRSMVLGKFKQAASTARPRSSGHRTRA